MMNTQSRQYIIDTYRKRAKNYDFTANLYYLLGYREWAYRRRTVGALNLKPGDTVVEIACGTGLNFALFQEVIGPQGKIIGVDLTDAMLKQAQKKVVKNGWNNVSLVQSDALNYRFPDRVDGIVSTYALSLMPNLRQILQNGANALAMGGRLALLELQVPAFWPGWMASLALTLMKPFAVTEDWLNRKPWETIRQTMNDLLNDVTVTERYLGLTYIIAGEKSNPESH